MIDEIILGIVQGITEWLPVSSSGMIILVQSNFLGGVTSLADSVEFSLFLHLGTFFAALIYFRKDVLKIVKTIFNYRKSEQEDRAILIFLTLATIISGAMGYVLFSFLDDIESKLTITSRGINFFIGIMLLITALSQLNRRRQEKPHEREEKDLKPKDGIILGIMQGFAPVPGISRSGLTVSGLLLRGFRETSSLRLSFLMSLPIVLGGNIALKLLESKSVSFSPELLPPLFFSFLFGILTIHILLKIAEKISFGYFAFFFGILLIIASLIPVY